MTARSGLPWRLAWRRWRLRNQPVPRDGRPLDAHDAALFAEALISFRDTAGTEEVAEDELIAEALMSDEGAG